MPPEDATQRWIASWAKKKAQRDLIDLCAANEPAGVLPAGVKNLWTSSGRGRRSRGVESALPFPEDGMQFHGIGGGLLRP